MTRPGTTLAFIDNVDSHQIKSHEIFTSDGVNADVVPNSLDTSLVATCFQRLFI